MNAFFRRIALLCALPLIPGNALFLPITTWEKDVKLIRKCDQKIPKIKTFLALNALRKKRPEWWKIAPEAMRCAQKRMEKNVFGQEKYGTSKQLIRIFSQHPPLTLPGWNAYCKAHYIFHKLPQQRQDIQRAFRKFWIQAKMSVDDQKEFCTSFVCPAPKKKKTNCAWIAKKETHTDRMIALLLETGLMASQHITCAKELGKCIGLSSDHPLMLICRILTRNARNNDPLAIQKIQKLPYAIRTKPLISIAQVRYFIRCDQLDRAVKAWNAGRLGQGITFKDPYLQDKACASLKETGLALMHNLWTKGQQERKKGQIKKANLTFSTALKGPYPDFFSKSADFLCLRGIIFYTGLRHNKSALINFQKAIHLIDTRNSLEKGPLCRHKSKALFWSGLCYERMKNKKRAIEFWQKAADFGFYFYGQMAQYKLGRPITMRFSKANIEKGLNNPQQKQMVRIINTLHKQDKTHQYPIVDALVKDLENISHTPHDKKKALCLIEKMAPSKVPHSAKMMSRDASCIFPQAYPMASVPIPHKDPALVQAIISAESAFEPKAISAVGAQGLMQVMPPEAKHFCTQLNIPYNQDSIFDPSINIRLGTEVLKDKQKKMASLISTLASYNAGETRVSEWLKRAPPPKTDQDTWTWIESIPFAETRHYIPCNLANYATYRWLSGQCLSSKEVCDMLSIQKPRT
jgi:hypothetical protein